MGDLQCRDSNAEMGKGDGEIRVGKGLQAGQLIWLMSWGGLARLLYPGRQQTELLVVLAELLDGIHLGSVLTTSVLASMSCQPCLRGARPIQKKPRPRGNRLR